MKRKGLFGSLVLGAKRAAEEREFVKSPARKFGPLVLGTRVKPGTNTPAANSQPVVANPSVKQLKEILDSNPAFVTQYCSREFTRETVAIRPAALKMFIEYAPKAYPQDAVRAKKIIDRCQAFLDGAADPDREGDLDKTRIARGKQVGLADVNKEPGAAKVKPATAPGGGKLKDDMKGTPAGTKKKAGSK